MTEHITVGVDPHRRVFTATVLDQRGRDVGHGHFENNRAGHAAVLAWARSLGPFGRVGIEGASGLGRPLAEFLVGESIDVRDVPPHKTATRQRGRHKARATGWTRTGSPPRPRPTTASPTPFKQHQPLAPDPVRDRIALWHNARTSLSKIRVQLIGELDAMIHDLPEELRDHLSARMTVRARINSVAALDTTGVNDPVVRLRLQLIDQRVGMLREVLAQDKTAATELAALVTQSGSTLTTVVGIAARAAAEILLETGDVRRFTEAGFARFNGTAPIPATSGEAGGTAGPAPAVPRRQPPPQRRHTPHRDDPTPLRTTRQTAPRPRPGRRPHPPRSHAHPQTPPVQRHLPHHAPRHPTPTRLDMRASSAAPA